MRWLLTSGLAIGLACTSTVYEDETVPAPAGGGGAGGARGGAGGSGGGAARKPALRIMSPAPNGTVDVGADNLVPIAFMVSDFTLKMPGTCGEDRWCGHVHLKVDGDACNNTAAGRAYNAAGFASPINANLGYCPAVAGTHRIELELHRDDHSPVTDASSEKVAATMSFTAMQMQVTPEPPEPEPPSITISSPSPDGTVTMGADQKVPIAFTVSGFTLRPPGMCTEADAPCGHVHLKVDGMACNNVAAGKPYNAAGAASPIQADLALCPAAAGAHTAVLELRNDDHSAHMHEGASITATVRFVAREY